MKKFLFILSLVVLIMTFGIVNISYSATTNTTTSTTWTTTNGLKRVQTIGNNLLKKNGLPTTVTFKVVETDEINAFASNEKEICVYTGLLQYVNNDEELAGVIAHEIGHIINNHIAKQSIFSTITTSAIQNTNLTTDVKNGLEVANALTQLKISRSDEYEADITGVDLMQKAGYNPLAMVSILYKISGNYFDFTSDHPSGDKRTMYIYDYITYTYSAKAKAGYTTDSYKKFMEYASPIVQKRNANAKTLAKFNKEQAKLKQKREKKLEKYKQTNNTTAWDVSYSILNAFTSDSSETSTSTETSK